MNSRIGWGLFVISMALLCATAKGASETIDGVTWYYDAIGETSRIYNNDRLAVVGTGNLTIPDVLGGKPVVSIGNYAFKYCVGVTGVTIPNSVTNIGDFAFYECSALASVVIPCGVKTIGEDAFYSCRSLTDVVIPDSVTSIGREAFGNSGLKSVAIPDSVKAIGFVAFHDCLNLNEKKI